MAELSFGTLVKAQASQARSKSEKQDESRGPRPQVSERTKTSSHENERPKSLKRKRDNKHAPTEVSSKKPVGRSREAIEVQKIERRDPRFDPDLTTKAPNTAYVNRNYGFLEDYKKDEMRILKEKIKKETNLDVKAKLEKTLGSMQSREQASKERERRQRVLSEFKNKERAAAKDGKIPYHLKAADKNKLYLKDKFDSMKDSKSLDKFLEKKRKRRSQKDRKRALPS